MPRIVGVLLFVAAQGVAAQSADSIGRVVWRSADSTREFVADSAACSTKARQISGVILGSAFEQEYGRCLRERAWRLVRIVQSRACESITIAPMIEPSVVWDSAFATAIARSAERTWRREWLPPAYVYSANYGRDTAYSGRAIVDIVPVSDGKFWIRENRSVSGPRPSDARLDFLQFQGPTDFANRQRTSSDVLQAILAFDSSCSPYRTVERYR